MAFTSQGRTVPHLPQCGAPFSAGVIRFFAPRSLAADERGDRAPVGGHRRDIGHARTVAPWPSSRQSSMPVYVTCRVTAPRAPSSTPGDRYRATASRSPAQDDPRCPVDLDAPAVPVPPGDPPRRVRLAGVPTPLPSAPPPSPSGQPTPIPSGPVTSPTPIPSVPGSSGTRRRSPAPPRSHPTPPRRPRAASSPRRPPASGPPGSRSPGGSSIRSESVRAASARCSAGAVATSPSPSQRSIPRPLPLARLRLRRWRRLAAAARERVR